MRAVGSSPHGATARLVGGYVGRAGHHTAALHLTKMARISQFVGTQGALPGALFSAREFDGRAVSCRGGWDDDASSAGWLRFVDLATGNAARVSIREGWQASALDIHPTTGTVVAAARTKAGASPSHNLDGSAASSPDEMRPRLMVIGKRPSFDAD